MAKKKAVRKTAVRKKKAVRKKAIGKTAITQITAAQNALLKVLIDADTPMTIDAIAETSGRKGRGLQALLD